MAGRYAMSKRERTDTRPSFVYFESPHCLCIHVHVHAQCVSTLLSGMSILALDMLSVNRPFPAKPKLLGVGSEVGVK